MSLSKLHLGWMVAALAAAGCGQGTVSVVTGCDTTRCGDPGCATDAHCAGVCGDNVVAINEECDDGNTTAGDGCDATCHTEIGPTCGDGNVDAGEACDDGNNTDGDGCDAACV